MLITDDGLIMQLKDALAAVADAMTQLERRRIAVVFNIAKKEDGSFGITALKATREIYQEGE